MTLLQCTCATLCGRRWYRPPRAARCIGGVSATISLASGWHSSKSASDIVVNRARVRRSQCVRVVRARPQVCRQAAAVAAALAAYADLAEQRISTRAFLLAAIRAWAFSQERRARDHELCRGKPGDLPAKLLRTLSGSLVPALALPVAYCLVCMRRRTTSCATGGSSQISRPSRRGRRAR